MLNKLFIALFIELAHGLVIKFRTTISTTIHMRHIAAATQTNSNVNNNLLSVVAYSRTENLYI